MRDSVTDAFAPFPFHTLVNVTPATIISNTVCFNEQETLPLILGMVDLKTYSKNTTLWHPQGWTI
ncbi:MAG: phage major capsid domain-containing protein [Flammeovirgaceae bacterium]